MAPATKAHQARPCALVEVPYHHSVRIRFLFVFGVETMPGSWPPLRTAAETAGAGARISVPRPDNCDRRLIPLKLLGPQPGHRVPIILQG